MNGFCNKFCFDRHQPRTALFQMKMNQSDGNESCPRLPSLVFLWKVPHCCDCPVDGVQRSHSYCPSSYSCLWLDWWLKYSGCSFRFSLDQLLKDDLFNESDLFPFPFLLFLLFPPCRHSQTGFEVLMMISSFKPAQTNNGFEMLIRWRAYC